MPGLIFFLPESNYIGVIADVCSSKGKCTSIVCNLQQYVKQINKVLRDLYIPLGGYEISYIRIPEYNALIQELKNGLQIPIRQCYQRIFKSGRRRIRLGEISIEPKYLVLRIDKKDQEGKPINRLIIMLDLKELPRDIDDIPIAWRHVGDDIDTWCIVIGYREVVRRIREHRERFMEENLEEQETESEITRGNVYQGIVCPLTYTLRTSSAISTMLYRKICPNIYKCRGIEDKNNTGVMYGSDILSYVLETKSSIRYDVSEQQNAGETINIPINGLVEQIRNIDIRLQLYGFKLGLKRLPRTYIGTYKYYKDYWFTASISHTNILRVTIDSRHFLAHYYYYILNDPRLKYITALKLLLLRKTGGYIPGPVYTMFSDPALSITRLRKQMNIYLRNQNKFFEDLDKYVEKLEKLSIDDKFELNYIESLAIHTFTHLLYLSLLTSYNASTDDLGIIIKRKIDSSEPSTLLGINIDNIDDKIKPMLMERKNEIIVYEKADSGLGYLTNSGSIRDAFINGIKTLRKTYQRIDEKIIEYRKNTLQQNKGVINKLYSDPDLSNILDTIINYSNTLIDRSKKSLGKEYSLVPGWLVRYGVNELLNSITSNEKRRVIESYLWTILDSYFDVSWDVSPDDLIIKGECVYYDLIQYFTLSRIYAVHLINDILKNYDMGQGYVDILSVDAGSIYRDKVKYIGSRHFFYTPWIDDEGGLVIRRIITHEPVKELYLLTRKTEKAKLRDLLTSKKYSGIIKVIHLEDIYRDIESVKRLHAKSYMNDGCEVVVSSINLTKTSLHENPEAYVYQRNCIVSKYGIGLTSILYNSMMRRESN